MEGFKSSAGAFFNLQVSSQKRKTSGDDETTNDFFNSFSSSKKTNKFFFTDDAEAPTGEFLGPAIQPKANNMPFVSPAREESPSPAPKPSEERDTPVSPQTSTPPSISHPLVKSMVKAPEVTTLIKTSPTLDPSKNKPPSKPFSFPRLNTKPFSAVKASQSKVHLAPPVSIPSFSLATPSNRPTTSTTSSPSAPPAPTVTHTTPTLLNTSSVERAEPKRTTSIPDVPRSEIDIDAIKEKISRWEEITDKSNEYFTEQISTYEKKIEENTAAVRKDLESTKDLIVRALKINYSVMEQTSRIHLKSIQERKL
ncbi:hypothetical protein PROFUN_08474 [Planoprotostelium fungivorum]|uniref:Uncharacterized protein n=1 Tax=Planoprotostelium fungivorum TaxID=1890364 RepID=A0A2P6N1Y5_9EUKA|nr:hypothetical protein PROFUN_08474 [Planoprotostelium fungivorum]